MLSYPGYPTPPSTMEESPVSYTTLSPASYVSEGSSSPGLITSSQLVILPQNVTIIPCQTSDLTNDGNIEKGQPYLQITEEPMDKFRFRYKSEMTGTHGCLNGERSDKTRKMTYPTVKLHNFKGTAIIRCSIWQINHHGNDFMPHAHRLVKKRHGREEADDPHEIEVDESTNYEASFYSMGIIHTAKKNIVSELIRKKTMLMQEAALRQDNRQNLTKKEEMEIKGLAEAESKSINLNIVCLRFDAFYVPEDDVRFPICSAVFSHAINNLKSALTGELKIVRMDHCTSPASGGREIFLLVERVTKKNIKVRFYELNDNDELVWEEYGHFNDLDVHHQYAIVLRTPAYKDRDISKKVNVFMELVRPSDNAKSEPMTFTYTPVPKHCKPGAKRARPNDFDSGDYDTGSSSIGSAAIPRTIQHITENFSGISFSDIDSAELNKLIGDIDSKEFNNLFNENKNEYEMALFPNSADLMSTDFPVNPKSKKTKLTTSGEQNSAYKEVDRAYREITEFLKTKPTDIEMIKNYIRHYLSNFCGHCNAVHLAVLIGNLKMIEFFMKIIIQYRLFDIINIHTKNGLGTILHMAVRNGDNDLVQGLVTKCRADISAVDKDMNTPLHLASEDSTGNMTKCLMSAPKLKSYIDLENKNGNTALHRAVKRGNIKVAEILHQNGANVNHRHPKNGYTPLRFAADNRDTEMIKFLIYKTNANPMEEDFTGINIIQAVNQIDDLEEIVSIIQKYTVEHNISCNDNIDIKEEPEDIAEYEKEIFEEVKAEPLALGEDYQNIFQNIEFTEECIDEISKEIDSSGKWQDLAMLLDIEHLLNLDPLSKESPGKKILTIAREVATVKEIRGFLEDLEETKAVEAIDRMTHFHSS
ncbi:nuclear factor NF-kappa-B p110 subunit isoform X2 [Harmonia axyridis]|nr:nuclear factor NF-kappa-B p110 subunit isoform X2 [Harmonia axyridis]